MFENWSALRRAISAPFCNRSQWDVMRQRALRFVESERSAHTNIYRYDPVYHFLLQHNRTAKAA
jgi:hypothetical protein